ncbi:MAG: DUF5687 family protein [Bacteroidota bacterium]
MFSSFAFQGQAQYLFLLSTAIGLALLGWGGQDINLNQSEERMGLVGSGLVLLVLYAALFQQLKKKVAYRDIHSRSLSVWQISGEGWFWDEWKLLFRNQRFNAAVYLPILASVGLPILYFFPGLDFPRGSGPLLSFVVTGGFVLNYWLSFPGWESTYFSLLMISPTPFEKLIYKKYLFSVIITLVPVVPLMLVFAFIDLELSLQIGTAFLLTISLLFYVLLFNATNNDQRIELDESGFFNQKGLKFSHYAYVAVLIFGLQFWPSFTADLSEQSLRYIWIGTVGLAGISLIFLKPVIRICANRILRKKYHLIRSYDDKSK